MSTGSFRILLTPSVSFLMTASCSKRSFLCMSALRSSSSGVLVGDGQPGLMAHPCSTPALTQDIIFIARSDLSHDFTWTVGDCLLCYRRSAPAQHVSFISCSRSAHTSVTLPTKLNYGIRVHSRPTKILSIPPIIMFALFTNSSTNTLFLFATTHVADLYCLCHCQFLIFVIFEMGPCQQTERLFWGVMNGIMSV
jgi:hypothetical protein